LWDNMTALRTPVVAGRARFGQDRHGDIARAEDVSAELTAMCKQAGIPRVTPNELRHTAASLANDAGVRLEELADQLGHKDVRMVSQVSGTGFGPQSATALPQR
jgi:integrase